jgi:hypothetical protein
MMDERGEVCKIRAQQLQCITDSSDNHKYKLGESPYWYSYRKIWLCCLIFFQTASVA